MTVRILTGDCRELLKTLPDSSVNCVVTSPPYWGLRDYGIADQLGLETTPFEYVEHMVAVFRDVRRVLADDGTLWLNIGDCYATGAGSVGAAPGGGEQGARWKGETTRHRDENRRPHGQPAMNGRGEDQASAKGYRGGHALNDAHQGKHLRKGSNRALGPMTQPNRMPIEGLKPKDLVMMPARLALALQADGWWVRSDIIWAKPNPMPESVTDRPTKSHEYLFLMSKSERYYYDAAAIAEPAVSAEEIGFAGSDGSIAQGESNGGRGQSTRRFKKAGGRPSGWAESDDGSMVGRYAPGRSGNKERKPGSARGCPEGNGQHVAGSVPWEGITRNKRTVWTVNTQPFKEAHFATFPPALVEPCILAGSARGGVILDPFGGAGTTGLVADRLGRDAILLELNPEYAAMAERRIHGNAPLFADVSRE